VSNSKGHSVISTCKIVTFTAKEVPAITITYDRLAEYLNEAGSLQRIRQSGHPQSSDQPSKKRKRASTPLEELSSDAENLFRDAEEGDDVRTDDRDEDFQGQASHSTDLPERRRSKRIKEERANN
jgi:hypothetical protein